MSWREMDLPARALEFATKAHQGQYRKGEGKVPYITHPVAVADILWECGERSPVLLAAALLHDTIEDCGVAAVHLAIEFGSEVAGIVAEVTDEPGLKGKERKNAQVEKAPFMSKNAKKLKIADKTANLTDIVENSPGWSVKTMHGYAEDAARVVNATASAIGYVADRADEKLRERFFRAAARVLAIEL